MSGIGVAAWGLATVSVFAVVAVAATLVRARLTALGPHERFPIRTLAVNTIGSWLLGISLASQWWDNPVVLTVAGLGSLTTFSTIAAETESFVSQGRRLGAASYVGITVVAGIGAAWLGIGLGEALRG